MPGPLHAGDAAGGESRAESEQRVDERAVAMTRRGMHDEPGRLVHDQQVVVLVHDLDRDLRLGARLGGGGRRHHQLQDGPRLDEGVRLDRESPEGQVAVGDELLDVAPGHPAEIGCPAVRAAAARLGRDQHPMDGRDGVSHRPRPVARWTAGGSPQGAAGWRS